MQNKSLSQHKSFSRLIVISTLFLFFIAVPVSVFADEDSIATLRQMGKAFSSIAEKASPAVVGIRAQRTVTQEMYIEPFGGDLYEFFSNPRGRRQQQPQRRYQETRPVQGSGFIISPDGYILTNNHMVEEVETIEIELTDGRKFTAKVTGTDPESDIAVVKIDAENLPYLKLADSDVLAVGEWVLAIGNPLGLSHTVTAGIVSATGRSVGLTELENFIQTDAAINFGNSGGPLINLDGEVVGINTAIAGSSGNIGIGFAVPINMAKYAYEQIKESGTVERGLLGISRIKDLDPLSATISGLPEDTKGVLVPNVIEDSAADKAGITHNDIILEVDGKPVDSAVDLQSRISMLKPGTKVELTIWRDGKRKEVDVELGKRSEVAQLRAAETIKDLGFSVENLTDELKERYGYEDMTGVIVTDVQPGSEAQRQGIAAGVLIKEVNRQSVRNTREFNQAIERARSRGLGGIMILVYTEGNNDLVTLRLP